MIGTEDIIISDISINGSILWFSITDAIKEPVKFEVKYLDDDNNKSPRTWTQIFGADRIDAFIDDRNIGFRLDSIRFSENIAGVEIRVICNEKKYNLQNKSEKNEIGIFEIKYSRKTICISLKSMVEMNFNTTVTISRNKETDKIVFEKCQHINFFEPTYFLIGKRYCVDSNCDPKVRKELIRRGEGYTVLLDNNKYWDYKQEDCTLDCFIEYKHVVYDYSIVIPIRIESFEDYVIDASNCKRKWYRTMNGTLACYIQSNDEKAKEEIHATSNNSKRVRIATWGSCYTRNMFQNYYNDNWRSVVDVCDSYFWFSVISATSKKIEDAKFDAFKIKASEQNLLNVNREIYKKTFQYLEASKAEYLLIDFYADAVAGVRKINEESYIGQGVAFSPDMQFSELYEDLVQSNYEKIDYRNPKYWDLWKQHCTILNKRLTELGYTKKVILIEGEFITKFKDNNNQIYDYREISELSERIDVSNIKAREGLWHEMNNYYKSLNPECKVLNMSQFHYLGDRENKMLGPNHFEPNYYKTEFAELCKLILMDKLN